MKALGDKYAQGAEKVMEAWADDTISDDEIENRIAAFGRECAAQAYEDAAKIMDEIDCYCCQHDEHPEGLCLLKAKAAALRAPEPKENGK